MASPDDTAPAAAGRASKDAGAPPEAGGMSAAVWIPSALSVMLLSVSILHVGDMITLFWLGTFINVALSVVKMCLAQIATHPKALMADAIHGLGDTVAEVVTALAYTEAARPPDKEHPWGHGKIESVGAVVVAGILLYIAATMGWDSLSTIIPLIRSCVRPPEVAPAAMVNDEVVRLFSEGRLVRRAAIAVTVASVLLKEALFTSTLVVGEREHSNLIVASAWHHRSDALAAGAALGSQLGASFGHHYLDPVGSGMVSAMLAHSAFGSLRESFNELVDYNAASSDGHGSQSRCGGLVSESISHVAGVRNHSLRARRMGPYCLVDATIVVDARISASAASVIAESVHDRVLADFRPFVTDVLVHVDPEGSPQSHRLDTQSEPAPQPPELLQMVGPEALELRVRDALLSLTEERPDLPRIVEVTELQSYYYVEEGAELSDISPYVDIKADIRLQEDVTIRSAAVVARAARSRVLAELPGIVRDIDLDLELDEGGGYAAPADSGDSPVLPSVCAAGAVGRLGASARPAASCPRTEVVGDQGAASQGRWDDELQADAPGPLAGHLPRPDGSHELRRVTLIWERGSESREARVPTSRHSRSLTWKLARAPPPERPLWPLDGSGSPTAAEAGVGRRYLGAARSAALGPWRSLPHREAAAPAATPIDGGAADPLRR